MAGYPQATLIKRVRQLTGDDPWEDYTTEAIASAGDLTIKVADTTDWEVGDVGEFQDDGEQFKVTALTDATTLTVRRGHKGTTAAPSHATDVVVFKAPTFSRVDIVDGIKGVISGLWPYAWKTVTQTVNVDNLTEWYDLNAQAIDLVKVAQAPVGGLTGAMRYYGAKDGYPVMFRTDHPTHGTAIRFPQGVITLDNDVTVTTRALITPTVTTALYDDILSTDETLAELIAYGVSARLVIAKEIPRVTQEDSRQPDVQVPPQARISAGQIMNTVYITLRNQYQDYLRRTAGPMKVWSQ